MKPFKDFIVDKDDLFQVDKYVVLYDNIKERTQFGMGSKESPFFQLGGEVVLIKKKYPLDPYIKSFGYICEYFMKNFFVDINEINFDKTNRYSQEKLAELHQIKNLTAI